MAKKTSTSLEDFVKQKIIDDCVVCALPDDIREQLESASDKSIKRNDQLAWLETLGHGEIGSRELNRHYSGRHPRVSSG